MKTHLLIRVWILWILVTAFAEAQQPDAINVEDDSNRYSNTNRIEIRHRDTFLMGEHITVRSNEVTQSIALLGGSALIEGTVEGELVVIGGSATIKGKVQHDVVVVCGSVTNQGTIEGSLISVLTANHLGSRSVINRDLTVVAGPIEQESGAIVRDDRIVIPIFFNLTTFSWIHDWIKQGLFYLRPFPPGVTAIWFISGFMLILYLFFSLVFAKPLNTCVGALDSRPLASLVTGIVTLMLIGPIFILLAVSVVGIIAIPFVACGLVIMHLFGNICVYRELGHQIGKQLGLSVLSHPMTAFVFGMGLFCLLYMVPIIGFIVKSLVLVMGLGAVILAFFGSMRRDKGDSNGSTVMYTPPQRDTISETNSSSETTSSLPRVGFWLRFWASVLDISLVSFLLAILGSPHLIPAAWIIYHIGLWTWRATTMGGIVLGLRVVRLDGQEITFAVALVRGLASCLSAIPLFLGFFWAGWDADRQSWHDKIAGTVIVREPKGTSLILF